MDEAIGQRIARAALGWVGTPFHHRAAIKGVGCDCIGLVLGVWREIGGAAGLHLPVYAPSGPNIGEEARLLEGLEAHLRPLGGIAPVVGDVVAFRMREAGPVQHIGILTATGQGGQFVHAYSRRGVVESRLSEHWQTRIVAAFRMPVEGA